MSIKKNRIKVGKQIRTILYKFMIFLNCIILVKYRIKFKIYIKIEVVFQKKYKISTLITNKNNS